MHTRRRSLAHNKAEKLKLPTTKNKCSKVKGNLVINESRVVVSPMRETDFFDSN
jgi:hypothetical protein